MASFGERVVGAMRLDTNTFEEIERDPSAMSQTVGVITLAAVSFGIGNLYYGGISGIVTQILISLIGYVVWSCVVWIIGTKVMPDPATKADFAETFRTIGFAAAPGVLGIITIIPILGWLLLVLLTLWQLAAMVVAVRAALDYSTIGKAIIVVVIGWVVNLMVSAMLAALFIGTALMRGALR
jgi:Yip1-like protein